MGNVMLVHEPIQSAFEYYTNVMKYNSNDFILFDKDNKSSKLRYIFNIISINKLDNKKIYYDDVNEYNKIDINSIMRYPIRQKRIQYVDDELEKKYNKLSKMIKKSKINNTLNDAKLYDLLNSGISLEYILNFLKEKGKGEKEKK
jgi:wyosine [tRNA(Phe)-imidazoG37] synthetase (radical SAM superfamily)